MNKTPLGDNSQRSQKMEKLEISLFLFRSQKYMVEQKIDVTGFRTLQDKTGDKCFLVGAS